MMEDVQANYAVNSSYDGIVSGYNELDGFYLLSLPAINKAYCLDLKARNQDSSAHNVDTSIDATLNPVLNPFCASSTALSLVSWFELQFFLSDSIAVIRLSESSI